MKNHAEILWFMAFHTKHLLHLALKNMMLFTIELDTL